MYIHIFVEVFVCMSVCMLVSIAVLFLYGLFSYVVTYHCNNSGKVGTGHIYYKRWTFQPAYSVGPPSARQRNAIRMAFRWRADGGPLLVIYWALTKYDCLHILQEDVETHVLVIR